MTGHIRAAARALTRAPAFTVVAVVTLSVGVAANTAVFGVFRAMALRELPFEQPEELVSVALDLTGRDGPEQAGLTAADLLDFRAEPGLFSGLAGWSTQEVALTGAGVASVMEVASVTEGMFARVLRAQPTLGRSFVSEEHRPGASATVLLTHALWIERLAGDPAVLGKALFLDGVPHTIVGVMPPDFRSPFAPSARLWTAAKPIVERCRDCATFSAIGRLAPGTTLAVADDRGRAVAQRRSEAYPDTEAGVSPTIAPLGAERGRVRAAFRFLFAATGLALLVACANVATLLLARGRGRRTELQLRAAVGAQRGHLIRHLVLEAAVLAGIGSAIAVLLAAWGTELFVGLAPAGVIPEADLGVDRRLLALHALLALGAVFLFGVLPSFLATRRLGGAPVRRAPGPGSTPSATSLVSSGLLTAQIALATALTVGFIASGRAVRDLRDADLGFDPHGVLVLDLEAPEGPLLSPGHLATVAEFMTRAAELPGVLSVGATSASPLAGPAPDEPFRVQQEGGARPGRGRAELRLVGGAYFYTVGQRIVKGRDLRTGDETANPQPVVVNESFARAYLGDRRGGTSDAQVALTLDGFGWRRVVGIVADTRSHALPERPAIYAPVTIRPTRDLSVVIASDGAVDAIGASARGVLATIAPEVATAPAVRLEDLVADELAPERFAAALLGAFAGVALVLSGLGLFSVLALRSRVRRPEAGIRLALGAESEDLRRAIVIPGIGLTLAGVAGGAVVAAWIAGLLQGVMPTAGPVDPEALGLAAVALLVVGGVAAWFPAHRTARTDPASALRDE